MLEKNDCRINCFLSCTYVTLFIEILIVKSIKYVHIIYTYKFVNVNNNM